MHIVSGGRPNSISFPGLNHSYLNPAELGYAAKYAARWRPECATLRRFESNGEEKNLSPNAQSLYSGRHDWKRPILSLVK